MKRVLLVAMTSAVLAFLLGCGMPRPGVYVSPSRACIVYGDGGISDLVESSEAVVVARVVRLGAPPRLYYGAFAGPFPQLAEFQVVEVLKGELSDQTLTIVYDIWPYGKYIRRGREPERLDPSFFAPGRKLVLFIPSLTDTATIPAPNYVTPEHPKTADELLGPNSEKGISLSDPVLTNKYSERLVSYLRHTIEVQEFFRTQESETGGTGETQ